MADCTSGIVNGSNLSHVSAAVILKTKVTTTNTNSKKISISSTNENQRELNKIEVDSKDNESLERNETSFDASI